MTDPNLLYSPEDSISLLSKSSPSQLQAFQFKGSRTQPIPAETLSLQKANKSNNLSHVPCKFFKQGTCTAGANCTFSHSSDISSESSVCRYFIKGNCKFDTKCALLHTLSPYSNGSSSSVDRKIRLNERSGSASSYSYSSSSFTTIDDKPIWNPRDLMALHSSSASFGTPPFNNNSNSKWNIPSSFDNNNSHHQMSNSINIDNNNNGLYQQQQCVEGGYNKDDSNHYDDEINDAMLPSSLNDLFTPSELHSRRLRQQEGYLSYSSLGSKWRVPFITKNDWFEDNGSTRLEDDDVQFFMEEDETTYNSMENTLSTLFQNKTKITQNNVHHSLL